MTTPARVAGPAARWLLSDEARADRPALLTPGRAPLSHADLDAAVVEVASTLTGAGIHRTDRVTTMIAAGPETAVGFLGVAAAAACAPLNPELGQHELEFYLGDLAPAALVVSTQLETPARDVATRLGIPVVELEARTDDVAGRFRLDVTTLARPAAPVAHADRDDVALLLHTSGTTGRAKVVPLTHGNLHASATNVATTLELAPSDRCLDVMPLFHIHGLVAGLLASLRAGASVVCTPRFRADDVGRWIRELEPTWYTAVPTIHQAMIEMARREGGPWPFRLIRSSSAALSPTVMAALEDAFGAPVIEAYGMTEAAHQIASNPLPPRERKRGSVGLAAGPEVAIMDDAGDLCAPDTEGEIVVRGTNVMRGYTGAGNELAFTNGWFRTGDVGALDADGYLRITGRRKEIINRGGEKIAPRDVDEALLSHPDVAQAVTFAAPHPTLGEDVAAAVVLVPGAGVTKGALREHVRGLLAPWKVPRQLLVVDHVPAGATGKLQRIGLAGRLGVTAPVATPLESPAYVGARDDLERRLAVVVQRVLSLDHPPSVEDDFFEMGADSLHAVQLLAEVEAELGRPLPDKVLVDHASVARFAAALRAGGPTVDEVDIVTIQRGGRDAPLFCLLRAGSLLPVRAMAAALDSSRPVHGISLPAMHSTWRAGGDVTTLARRAVAALQAECAHGPYALLGHSLGGLIVYEMAHQLEEAGERIEAVVLVDVLHPDVVRHAFPRRYRPKRLGSILLRQGPTAFGRTMPWPLGSLFQRESIPGTKIRLDSAACNRRERRYRPPSVDARVIVLRRSDDTLPDWLGWTPLVTERWEQQVVPGSHQSMLGEPHLQVLAATLARALRGRT